MCMVKPFDVPIRRRPVRNFVAKYAKRCGAGRHGGKAKYNRKVKHKAKIA